MSKKSLTKEGIKGAVWRTSGSLLKILAQFVMLAVLARLISPVDFGYVAFIMILVGFTDLFSKMGIGGALIQMDGISDRQVRMGYTLSLFFGLILAVSFYFVTPYLAIFFNMEEIIDGLHFFAFMFPLKSLNSVSVALLNRDLRFDVAEKITLSSFVFGYALVSIIFAFFDYGYWALLYGQLAMLVVSCVYASIYHFPKFTFKWVKSEVNELLFFGSGFTFNTTLGYFSDTIDNLVVSKFIGAQALGIYSKAYQLYAIPAGIFGGVYDSVMFPILAKRKSDGAKLRDFYFFSISLCLLFLMPMGVVIALNAELIIKIVLGPGWEDAILILQILILSLPFRFGYRINRSFLKSLGLVYKGVVYEVIFFLSTAIFSVVGVKLYGLPGLAIGVLSSSILFFMIVYVYLSRLLKMFRKLNLALFKDLIVFNIPILAVCWAVSYYFDLPIWALLLISVVLLPVFLLILFRKQSMVLTEGNKILYNQVVSNLPKPAAKILGKVQRKIESIIGKLSTKK